MTILKRTPRWQLVLQALLVLPGLLLGSGCERAADGISAADVADNNRGVALMGSFDYAAARDTFEQLTQRNTGWRDARLNLAIATLNRQQEGDEQRALDIVATVLAEDPGDLRANYIAGLLRLYLGETALALEHFSVVTAGDPEDAYAAYFTGQALLQQGDVEGALDWYQRAIDRDPYLRSAYYGAALVLRRVGEPQDARDMLMVYERFADNPRARLAEFKYTKLGPKAEALAIGRERAQAAKLPPGPLFAPAVPLGLNLDGEVFSLTAADINADNLLDMYAATSDGTRVFIGAEDGEFAVRAGHPLAGIRDAAAALWGDIDNDGDLDLYLCRRGPNQLWLASGGGEWQQTAAANATDDPGDCADGGMIDADHDGDLDIFVVNADGANELFSNNGDGSFRRLGLSQGIAGDGVGRQFLAADLDLDRDLDLVVINDGGGNEIWINDRLWEYRAAAGMESFRQASLQAATIADLDSDGRPEIYAIDQDGRLLRWRWRPGMWSVDTLDTVVGDVPQLAVSDFDGDGSLKLVIASNAGISIRHPAGGMFQLPDSAGIAGPLLVLNLDIQAGPEIVAPVAGGLKRWPPGEGRLPFMGLSFSGKEDKADSMRSNRSGIGTRVSLRLLDRWTMTTTLDRNSAPGQSLQPLLMGLAGLPAADYVAIDWSDGVFQTELSLAQGELHRITETQRQLSSCPVIFAWNGTRYGFVSDVLGVGGLGFLIAPGEYAEPRPWEYFLMPAGSLAPRNGRYALKIAEPMEENAYLDAVQLHAYDLPPGWDMAVDERMATGAPDVTGRPIFFRPRRSLSPVAASNNRGEDVLDSVRAADRVAAPVGEIDHRFIGRLRDEHQLLLAFGDEINPAGSRPVLVADGWVEYPYSQTVFAAWQAGAEYEAPSLDALTADGDWHRVYTGFGYPAGMPREMALPLNELPPRTVALRLSTNLEVYWDRIRVVYEEQAPSTLVHQVLAPEIARLAITGFAARTTADQRLPDYDYDAREAFWDARYLDGFYTRPGPVEELIKAVDDAVAIIGSGEEVHLEFMAPDAVAQDWSRRFVLEARGWAKDMDLFTRDGGKVGPLPRSTPGDEAAEARRDELHQRYNNRYQSAR